MEDDTYGGDTPQQEERTPLLWILTSPHPVRTKHERLAALITFLCVWAVTATAFLMFPSTYTLGINNEYPWIYYAAVFILLPVLILTLVRLLEPISQFTLKQYFFATFLGTCLGMLIFYGICTGAKWTIESLFHHTAR